jgi:hypothetical protein
MGRDMSLTENAGEGLTVSWKPPVPSLSLPTQPHMHTGNRRQYSRPLVHVDSTSADSTNSDRKHSEKKCYVAADVHHIGRSYHG